MPFWPFPDLMNLDHLNECRRRSKQVVLEKSE